MRRGEEEEAPAPLTVKSKLAKETGSSHAVLPVRSCLAFEHDFKLCWRRESRFLLLRQAFVKHE